MKMEFLKTGLVLVLTTLLAACAPESLNPLNQGSHSIGSSNVVASRGEPTKTPLAKESETEHEVEIQEEIGETATSEISEEFIADWDSKSSGKEWTRATVKALETTGQDMLLLKNPSDSSEFCPRYSRLSYEERLQFYVMLISAMARHESGFDPSTEYKEGFKDSNGKPVVSRGLLQMSLESAKNYGCRVSKASHLHDVQKNIQCAVKILNRWVKHDRKIGSWGKGKDGETRHLGGGRYWSVLRKTSDSRPEIIGKTKALEICKS